MFFFWTKNYGNAAQRRKFAFIKILKSQELVKSILSAICLFPIAQFYQLCGITL